MDRNKNQIIILQRYIQLLNIGVVDLSINVSKNHKLFVFIVCLRWRNLEKSWDLVLALLLSSCVTFSELLKPFWASVPSSGSHGIGRFLLGLKSVRLSKWQCVISSGNEFMNRKLLMVKPQIFNMKKMNTI